MAWSKTCGREDERVVAGAIVGSLALDAGDRYSELLQEGLAGGLGNADAVVERLVDLF